MKTRRGFLKAFGAVAAAAFVAVPKARANRVDFTYSSYPDDAFYMGHEASKAVFDKPKVGRYYDFTVFDDVYAEGSELHNFSKWYLFIDKHA